MIKVYRMFKSRREAAMNAIIKLTLVYLNIPNKKVNTGTKTTFSNS